MTFRLFRVLIWGVCVIRLPYPQLDTFLGMIASMQHPWLIVIGNLLLTSGFALAMGSHFALGDQWRSGIDQHNPAGLKTSGLYRYSRNPAFVGVAVAQLGFFLSLPSYFSVLCLALGWLTLYRQMLAEEAYLRTRFKESYVQYCARVRRWV